MPDNAPTPAAKLTPIDALRSGDVLLLRGRSQISALIAWTCNDVYSHAAVVAEDGSLMESVTRGIVTGEVREKVAATDRYYLIDAFRPLAHDLGPLDASDRMQVVAHGASLLGLPYATNELAVIGVIVALRNHAFEDMPPWLRGVLRVAFDMLLSNDTKQMVCSEFVYRCFAENAARPVGRLAPRIVVAPPPTHPQPFDIDIPKLIEEIRELLGHEHAVLHGMVLSEDGLLTTEANQRVSAEALEAAAQAVRIRLGVSEAEVATLLQRADPVLPVSGVNPKGVSPGDLARTPSHQPLGRLMQASDWHG